jgi:hypothetical protein
LLPLLLLLLLLLLPPPMPLLPPLPQRLPCVAQSLISRPWDRCSVHAITYLTPLGSLLGACIIGRSVSIRPKKGYAQLLRSANYE